jgi:hypothetical protein
MLHSSEVFAEAVSDTPEIHFRASCDPLERRSSQRKGVFAAGLLSGGGLDQPIPCKIVDFSTFGARLEFAPDVARYQLGRIRRPSELKILIVAERSEAECAIIWRSNQLMGIRLKCALRRKPLAA